MEDVEQEAGAARPGAHDAPDAVAAHDTIDTAVAHAAKAAATAAPKQALSVRCHEKMSRRDRAHGEILASHACPSQR